MLWVFFSPQNCAFFGPKMTRSPTCRSCWPWKSQKDWVAAVRRAAGSSHPATFFPVQIGICPCFCHVKLKIKSHLWGDWSSTSQSENFETRATLKKKLVAKHDIPDVLRLQCILLRVSLAQKKRPSFTARKLRIQKPPHIVRCFIYWEFMSHLRMVTHASQFGVYTPLLVDFKSTGGIGGRFLSHQIRENQKAYHMFWSMDDHHKVSKVSRFFAGIGWNSPELRVDQNLYPTISNNEQTVVARFARYLWELWP